MRMAEGSPRETQGEDHSHLLSVRCGGRVALYLLILESQQMETESP